MKALGSLRCGVGLKNMHLAKFFSYRMESYKELTCEFFGSMSLRSVWVHYGEGTMELKEKNSKGFGLQSLKRYSSSRSKAAQIRSPVLEICAQGSCQHLLCKEGTGTINEGRVGWEVPIQVHTSIGWPSKLLLPNPELTTVVRGENIDFRPPVYTLVGHEDDLREEEPELDRAEDRAESQAEDRVQESAIWVSLSATTLRSMRLQG
ncbi:unnamed protein product [Microthlaspi erraticum]|uniref:Arabidopsis retrotransposon Orf1 C-terminal domain-containing protein n=1 Tax=Microthlaspi erraticum TaxID=1685480 RepID=A0A6D2K6W9_9BRAS|nr:unnamed protein product [Microthlaspi erraticum]